MRSTTMAKMAKGATGRWAAGGLPVARARRRWRDASVGRARRALSSGTRASGSSEAGPLGSGVHQPGDIVNDRYEVRGVLGMGGSGGDCFVAERRSDGSKVAMKVLSFRDMRNWKQLELFEREAKTLQNLSHPGIPRYVDYFEVDTQDDKRFYLIQEIAPGVTLTRRVEEEGWRPNEGEVKEIALRLLDILEYLGSLRPPVVHRDLKPDNIVVDAAGGEAPAVYLVDFGGVQAAAGTTNNSTIVGTFGYMAPEQFSGAAGRNTDLYGLGATMLYLLSGGIHPNQFPQSRLKIDFEGRVVASEDVLDVLGGKFPPPRCRSRF